MKAYCMKCRTKRDIENPKYEVNSICRAIVRGKCKICETKLYSTIKNKDAPANIQKEIEKCKKTGPKITRKKKRKSRKSRKKK